ncbi:MBL fold metallo-hydrolase [Parvularcula sp. ZS-1/3]|uniref:MBL fold metallo-hydrolase n=1 Tax=Parvularcula mediterranea TaxID=2732508 RepID=A0A7Y3W6F1_9PROT|nr:MBL fold metallo-hydrolase [Parvularcula mediterranea]NNU17664.1 MBL fold metallo-hydrolase [Parvularcula mediterranea]
MRRFLAFLILGLGVLGGLYWWAVENGTPAGTSYDFRLEELRAAASAPELDRPEAITAIDIGRANAPGFAVGKGLDFAPVEMAFTAYVIDFGGGTQIVVDAPGDRQIVEEELKGTFFPELYQELVAEMDNADAILVTHEHLDHLSLVPRHPRPENLGPALRLTPPQIEELPAFSQDGELRPPLDRLISERFRDPRAIAPGVAVLETPGHTEGSLTIFVQLQNGREYLLIGDIAWVMDNIENAKTRPRIMQTFFFDPPEDRALVQAQVRALHELQKAEPELVILPSHDAAQQDGLVREGVLLSPRP